MRGFLQSPLPDSNRRPPPLTIEQRDGTQGHRPGRGGHERRANRRDRSGVTARGRAWSARCSLSVPLRKGFDGPQRSWLRRPASHDHEGVPRAAGVSSMCRVNSMTWRSTALYETCVFRKCVKRALRGVRGDKLPRVLEVVPRHQDLARPAVAYSVAGACTDVRVAVVAGNSFRPQRPQIVSASIEFPTTMSRTPFISLRT